MSGVTAALVRREVGRLASGRVLLAGGLFALLFLLIAAISIAADLMLNGDPSERAAAVLIAGYRGTSGYDAVVFMFVLYLGVSQVGADTRAGTIFGILARPVSRARLFVTGWATSCLTILLLEVLRSGPIMGCAAWIEGRVHLLSLLGVLALWLGPVAMLSGFAALGAVIPSAYAVLVGLGAVIIAGLAYSEVLGGFGASLVNAVSWFLPLLSNQHPLIDAAIQGSVHDSGPILEVIAYRACWTLLLLFVGVYGFSRRDLAPRV